MKQKRTLYFAFLGASIAILFVACSNGGDDSPEDPFGSLVTDIAWYNSPQTEFVITTAEALAGLAKLVNNGNDFAGKTIKLGADIMLNDTANWQDWANNPPANEWIPIGASDVRITDNGFQTDSYQIGGGKLFRGTFDGNGYVISGVYINSTGSCKGLFSGMYGVGVIKKLGIVASYINGSSAVGGLIGCNYGTISNNYFTGTVTGRNNVGGLVGISYKYKPFANDPEPDPTVDSSYSAGTVTGAIDVGGLVGYDGGEINSSYSTSTVTGRNFLGGLVGRTYESMIVNSHSTGTVIGEKYVGGFVGFSNVTIISSSYSAGTVTGTDDVGGFVGCHDKGTIVNSYSTGTVSGTDEVGGFVGFHEATISNSYSTGMVTGEKYVGGFSGYASALNGYINNSYYNVETSGKNKASGNEDGYYAVPIAQGKTTAEMKLQTTFNNWNFGEIWGINSTINNGYPYLLNTMTDQ
ncbi:MAG: hypothetical protein LBH25_05460 [Fibromonadaceae bacterium]|jgi:hypothetical protein|nr:hypothetical protein [Fibromonadaceae bacterium]